jgi:N-formylmaleamate deformylase
LKHWQSGIVEVSAGYLAYHRTGGSGPPLVLLHGLSDKGLCWRRVAGELAGDFDIIMLDARGHGGSARISAPASWDAGRDIAEAMDSLGLGCALLMGHSVGGRAAAACANGYPHKVSALVLEDPNFLPIGDAAANAARREQIRYQIERLQGLTMAELIATGRALSPSWHLDEFVDWAQAKKEFDLAAVPLYRDSWQQTIERIVAPTLLIFGERALGGIVNSELAIEAVRINPNFRSSQVQGAGHNIHRENFPEFISTARAFLMWAIS